MASSIDDVLLDLYGAALSPASWSRVLDRLCLHFNVRSAVLQRFRPGPLQLNTIWLARDSYSQEHADLHDAVVSDNRNPRLRNEYGAVPGSPAVTLQTDQDFKMPNSVRRRFQNDLHSVGLGAAIFAEIPLSHQDHVTLSLHRHCRDGSDFSALERTHLLDLGNHMMQTFRISGEIHASRSRAENLRAVVECFRPGVAICDADTRLLWANMTARKILNGAGPVRVINGRICAEQTEKTKMLHQRVRDIGLRKEDLSERESWISFGANKDRHPPLHVVLVALEPSQPCDFGQLFTANAMAQVALIFTQSGLESEIRAEPLQKLFGLSPAEAQLTKAVAEGMTIRAYADSRGIAEGTARFQIKQVFAKTNCVRQADLVRLVWSSVLGSCDPLTMQGRRH